jgi:hypothetical protein
MEPFFALLAAMAKPLFLCLLGLTAVVGLIAVVSPRALTLVATAGNHWFDTWRFLPVSEKSFLRRLDRWIELDAFALRHCRALGCAVLVGATLLAYGVIAW